MFMVRLIYGSSLSEGCDVHQIRAILESARKNNVKNAITGMLCYNPQYFLQWIEGPREAINDTYHRILRDERHHGAILLQYAEITERRFCSWAMGYVSAGAGDQRIVSKYFPTLSFNPYQITGKGAQAFLSEIGALNEKKLSAGPNDETREL